LITNYELTEEQEEEAVVYAGGIKGIRALRLQRDNLPDVDEPVGNNNSKYEESKR
jgi:hypothetical protein